MILIKIYALANNDENNFIIKKEMADRWVKGRWGRWLVVHVWLNGERRQNNTEEISDMFSFEIMTEPQDCTHSCLTSASYNQEVIRYLTIKSEV